RGRGGYQNASAKENQESNHSNQKASERGGFNGNRGGRGGRSGRGGYKGFDKSNIQCYNCKKYGHFADECRGKNDAQDAEARMVKQDEGRKEWFTSLKSTQNSQVRFANNSTMVAKGMGDVSIKRKDGKCSMISNVLYIPGIKCNLLSIGQLLEKDYKIIMEHRLLNVFYTKGNLLLKAPMSKNRTFQIELNVMDHKCLMTAYSRDEWLWHYRMGHLNFKDLTLMQKKNYVSGLPAMNAPDEICEECLHSKQPRGSFSKYAMSKTKSTLEIVYSDGKHLPKELWGEAVTTATYILNLCPTKRLNGITPDECWFKNKPSVKHLRVFGSIAYKHVLDQLRRKLDDKATTMILVGYHSTGGYRLYDPVNKNVVKNSTSVMLEELEQNKEIVPETDMRRSTRARVLPTRLQEYELNKDNEVTNDGDLVHLAFMAESEPIDVISALKSEKWRCAMKEELDSIESNQTWELVDLPHNKRAIDVKWVYKLKMNSKGEITRHKARLVARGFLQREGIDYGEVFALVTRMETIRLVTAITNINDWPMYQMDVKSAFLNGPIEEEVFVTQPPGYKVKNQENKVYRLKKALYGLKQAPRDWNRRIDKFLIEIGFVKCVTEHGVYVKKHDEKRLIVMCLYVDDLLITGSNDKYISEFKSDLKREFEMTDLGHMTYFLGIEFLRTDQGIFMHQTRYAKEILKKFEMDKCNSALSTAEPRLQLSKSTEEEDVDPTSYRQLIGSLRYLCNTRPDLAYSVGIVSRFMDKPKSSHLIAAKRILRYVKGTIDYGVFFPANDRKNECKLMGYTDSNWCGDVEDRKSTAGYIFYFGEAQISWCSKKEPVVALSSLTLKVDNVSAINLAKNPIVHGRSKHIEMRFHYLREQVNNGNLALEYCKSEEQVADLFTKEVAVQVFQKLRGLIGMETVATTRITQKIEGHKPPRSYNFRQQSMDSWRPRAHAKTLARNGSWRP
ncbi:hypothetical protein TSUD_413780, partial [Trifolium subterraneum]